MNILSNIPIRSSFFRNVLTISSGTAISQILMVIATPILTRLYTPTSFGILALFSSLLAIAVVTSSLRYEVAIPLPKLNKHASYIVLLALAINTLLSLIILIIVPRFSISLATRFKAPLLADYLWLLPFGIFFLGIYKIFNFWAIRNRHYFRIGKSKIIQSLTSITIQVMGGFTGLGALSLIVGRILGHFSGTVSLMYGFKMRVPFKEKALLHKIWGMAKRYRNFLKYDVAASLVNTLNLEMPQIILAIFFGPMITGYYMLVDRVLAVPTTLIGQAVGQVYYGDWKKNLAAGSLLQRTTQIIKNLTTLMVLPSIVLFIMGKIIFSTLFGVKWAEAGIFASWMIFGAVTQFVYSPVSLALMATNGQKTNFIIHSGLLFLKVVASIIGVLLDSPLRTVQMFSLANVIGYGVGISLICQRVKAYSVTVTNNVEETAEKGFQ